jgi:hypothetical protein
MEVGARPEKGEKGGLTGKVAWIILNMINNDRKKGLYQTRKCPFE